MTRYNITAYQSHNLEAAVTAVSEHEYLLDGSVDLFALGTSFFSMSRWEAERLDAQLGIFLEFIRESLDDAEEATIVVFSQLLWDRLPDGRNFSEAASLPVVFITSI